MKLFSAIATGLAVTVAADATNGTAIQPAGPNTNDTAVEETEHSTFQDVPLSIDNAKRMAELSRVAFCPDIPSFKCGLPCDIFNGDIQEVKLFKSKHDYFQGYIAYDKAYDQIVIVFRGSVNTDNWMHDFDLQKVPPFSPGFFLEHPLVQIHKGFLQEYGLIKEEMFGELRNLRRWHPHAQLRVTGHSLGAAVASIAALDLQVNHHEHVDAVYTFGQPRVGNKHFADLYNEQGFSNYRFVHYHDPAPHVPMNWMGYEHVAQEIFSTDEDNTNIKYCDPHNGEDKSCSWSVNPIACIPNAKYEHMHYLNMNIGCAEWGGVDPSLDSGLEIF